MRNELTLLCMLACSAPAVAQVNINFGFPSVDIGINLRLYPELVPVPGYPVYYAPQMDSNYFFYDGMYWVYQDDDWYASSWYNGPWGTVDRDVVPVFILRIPVRYYRRAPVYFRGWYADSAPRWDQHWGNEWQQRRQGWDRWDHRTPNTRPPLPLYQRKYTGDKYPQLPQQQTLQNKNYRYQPHDPLVRQQLQEHGRHVTSMPTQIEPIRDTRDNQREIQWDNQRDTQRDSRRENPRDNQRENPRENPRATPVRVEPQRVAPQVQPQNHQPERERAQEQRQQTGRTQQAEKPAHDQIAPQEQNRAQKPEQQHERANEKSRDRGNDRDDERGHDRTK